MSNTNAVSAPATPMTNAAPTPIPASHVPMPTVSLAAFCLQYHIDDKDCDHLEKLEFHSGDDIESLGPDDWKDIGGFQQLAWQRILQKNQQLHHDIQNVL